ncbi:predicted protein [Nematostella vectensis]|uniref:Uncharacterized protein n=1 Tax=Nematostella vectensis TaxID=45351 RepID=A7RYG3_NEMVE|nr:predicted protein [Nematostella vectensis]|eukprot:XP_001635520.1 predicted protein [Nematostella vectensis]
MELTMKTTMLIALLSGKRCQTLHAFDISTMDLTDKHCIFYIQELLKSSRPSKHFRRLELKAYENDKRLCVVTIIKEYVERTKLLRGNDSSFLISF